MYNLDSISLKLYQQLTFHFKEFWVLFIQLCPRDSISFVEDFVFDSLHTLTPAYYFALSYELFCYSCFLQRWTGCWVEDTLMTSPPKELALSCWERPTFRHPMAVIHQFHLSLGISLSFTRLPFVIVTYLMAQTIALWLGGWFFLVPTPSAPELDYSGERIPISSAAPSPSSQPEGD